MPASVDKYVLPITFQSFTKKNVEQLMVLNSVIFPIKYPVSRYIHAYEWLSRLVMPSWLLEGFGKHIAALNAGQGVRGLPHIHRFDSRRQGLIFPGFTVSQ